MNRRSLIVLAAIALVSIGLAYLSQLPDRAGTDSGALVGERLIDGLESGLNEIERVAIVAPGGDAAVTLELAAEGWQVAEQDGYPADIGKIREALTALAQARILEQKTSNPDFYGRLGVEPLDSAEAAGIGVRIESPDAGFPTVILGDSSGTSYRFARLADEATSFLIDRNPELPTDPAQWVRPDIVDIRSARVQSVEIRHADGETLRLSKSTEGESNFSVGDIPEGRELQYASVANVTGNALRDLRLEAAARLGAAAPDPIVETEYRTFDGLVVTVQGRDYDGENWVSFAARFDPDQALRFASEPVDESVADATAAADDTDASAEASSINVRLNGWRFRIPSYQYEQMTRRMDDLLAPAGDETE